MYMRWPEKPHPSLSQLFDPEDATLGYIHTLAPSFYRLLLHLTETGRRFNVIFRTFGDVSYVKPS